MPDADQMQRAVEELAALCQEHGDHFIDLLFEHAGFDPVTAWEEIPRFLVDLDVVKVAREVYGAKAGGKRAAEAEKIFIVAFMAGAGYGLRLGASVEGSEAHA
jgi:hypothetical protein